MTTLLERLKPEHAATMAANQENYPTLFSTTVATLEKHTSIFNLTLMEINDYLCMINSSLTDDKFMHKLINSFVAENDIVIDTSQVEDIMFEDIDHSDAPDYCDAYISDATYFGRPMTEYELELLNEDSDFKYEKLYNYLH